MSAQRPITEECDNCGRLIGRLETAHVHGEHVVCPECHARLSAHGPPVGYSTPSVQSISKSVIPRAQTIEATAKVWKATQAAGVALFVPGVIMLVLRNRGFGAGWMLYVGGTVSVLGFLIYAVGAGAAWWFHG